jgi:microcystin-dependent protein
MIMLLFRTVLRLPALLVVLFLGRTIAFGQQSIGIGTTTPDSKAALDITSTQKGVLFPTLDATQQATLLGMLTPAEKGMLITDAATGNLKFWGGASWQNFTSGTAVTAKAPLSVATNSVKINPGTAAGDLLTWDGNNWVNMQPAVQHFSVAVDNRQPWLAVNFIISPYGIFPSQNSAGDPYVGEIYMMGCNFAVQGFTLCNGALLSISGNEVLFTLIGTTYGGDGVSTFAVPDLRSRVPVQMGNNGTSNYIIGQSGGSEQKTFSH